MQKLLALLIVVALVGIMPVSAMGQNSGGWNTAYFEISVNNDPTWFEGVFLRISWKAADGEHPAKATVQTVFRDTGEVVEQWHPLGVGVITSNCDTTVDIDLGDSDHIEFTVTPDPSELGTDAGTPDGDGWVGHGTSVSSDASSTLFYLSFIDNLNSWRSCKIYFSSCFLKSCYFY